VQTQYKEKALLTNLSTSAFAIYPYFIVIYKMDNMLSLNSEGIKP